LVHAAHESLIINTNIQNAISYLELADTQIQSLNNPQFTDIRQAISKTILTLKALPIVDQAGIIIKLDTLSTSIAELPTVFKPFIGKVYQAPDPNSEPYQRNNWKRKLFNALNHLKSFVIIRHNDQLPILTSEQQDFLKLMMQSKINQTEWAVLNYKQDLYQHNLQLISQWLNNYYQDNQASSALLKEINDLQSANLQLTAPNILDLLKPMQTHLTQLTNTLSLGDLKTDPATTKNIPSKLPETNPSVEA
jgi:uroporphyrin-III C-methyltransferase